MLSQELTQLLSTPIPRPVHRSIANPLRPAGERLTPLVVDGAALNASEMNSLVDVLFAHSGNVEGVEVLKGTFSGDALDLFCAESIRQITELRGGNQIAGNYPLGLFNVAELMGGAKTAEAIRGWIDEEQVDMTAVAVHLAIEKASAIAYTVALISRVRNTRASWNAGAVEKLLDQMCAKHGVSAEERQLRSLPTDPAKKRVAEKALEKLFEGGFSFEERIFREAVLGHPIVNEVAQRLVWATADSKLFRVAEPGDCTDARDAAVDLRFPVTIAHPASADSAEIEWWQGIWKSEKRTAPFAQWDRACIRADAARPPEKAVSPSALLTGLESRGWKRGRIEKGVLAAHSKEFPNLQTTAHVRYGAIPVTYGGRWGPRIFESVRFTSGDMPLDASKVNPLVISTVYSDLRAVAGEV